MHATNTSRGYIALISTIIVSFVLLTAVITVGMRGMAGRLYFVDFQNKQASKALAEACVNVAELKIANDPTYTSGPITRNVGTETCSILSVQNNSAGQSTIKASGVINGATTFLKVVVNTTSVGVLSWEETPTAP